MAKILQSPVVIMNKKIIFKWILREAASEEVKLYPNQANNETNNDIYNIEKDISEDTTSYYATIVLWAGILAMAIAIIIDLYLESWHTYLEKQGMLKQFLHALHYVLRDGGIAAASAGGIARLLEVKNLIDFTTKIVIRALTSNVYLEKLSLERIKEIKTYCNHHMLVKGGNRSEENLNQSIFKVETEIADYLFKPYYDELKIFVDCDFIEVNKIKDFPHQVFPPGTKVIKKEMKTRQKLVNPQEERVDAEKVESTVTVFAPAALEDPTILNTVTSFTYSVDGAPKQTLKVKYMCDGEFKAQKDEAYNVRLTLVQENGHPILIPFDDELEIEIVETRLIFIMDQFFIKKVKKPTKRITINYTFDEPNISLKGECFGFGELNSHNNNIYIDYTGQSVNIESTAWLLPGNGILIVHGQKDSLISNINSGIAQPQSASGDSQNSKLGHNSGEEQLGTDLATDPIQA